MLKDRVVDVTSRAEKGKTVSRRLRREGSIPAVLYGGKKPPVTLTVDPATIHTILSSEARGNTLFRLRLDGKQDKTRHVMIRDRQRDPVTGSLVHVDFIRIDLEKKVHVDVPLQIVGTAEGVKNEGGLLDFVVRTVQIACLPAEIPESLEVDVSELHIGQVFRVKDLSQAAGLEILTNPEQPLAVISAPAAAEAAATEEAAEVAEPGAEGVEETPTSDSAEKGS